MKQLLASLVLLLVVGSLASARAGGSSDSSEIPDQLVEASGTVTVEGGGEFAPGSSFKLEIALDVAAGWHINAHVPADEFLIPTEVTLAAPEGVELGELTYPEPELLAFAFSPDEKLRVYQGRVVVVGDGKVGKPLDVAAAIDGKLRFQACNDKSCLPPKKVAFSISLAGTTKAATSGGFDPAPGAAAGGSSGVAAAASAAGGSGPGIAARAATAAGGFDLAGRGLLSALLFVYVGGLLLNLTPCIYPMIPVTIGYFGNQSQGSVGRSFSLGAFYVLGMAVTYSTLGVVAALSGKMFGSLLQSPWVLGGIAGLMVALALSSFGLYEIRMPSVLTARASARTGLMGSLAMGLLMGIVAAPCIGPFVAGLLTYVAKLGDPVRGFLLFFALALGLGTPFLFLAAFSGSLKALPRSGAWMLGVRRIFGILLLGAAVYFVGPLVPPDVYAVAWRMCAVAAAVYLLGYEPLGQAPGKLGIGFKSIFAGLVFLVFWVAGGFGTAAVESIRFQPYSDALVTRAAAQGRPILVDFTADWCIPCRELEHRTFVDARVRERASGFMTLRADLTRDAPPEVEALMKRHGVDGPPTVLFLAPDGSEWRDLRVVGFVEPAVFVEHLEAANDRAGGEAVRAEVGAGDSPLGG